MKLEIYADAGPGDARFGQDEDLETLLPALAHYLANDAVRGWLFAANVAGKPLAFVVHRLDYVPPSSEETGKVLIDLRADAKGALVTVGVRISASDIAGKTVAEILAAKGTSRRRPSSSRHATRRRGAPCAGRVDVFRRCSLFRGMDIMLPDAPPRDGMDCVAAGEP
jgi:hypothetical protein